MEFGKLSSLSNLKKIDFRLPPDVPHSVELLSRHRTHQFQAYVGAPVWGVKKWLGSVYPKGTQADQFLYHYSRQFHCIELNTTHYRIPDTATIERWRSSVPPEFRFCPKFPQSISHTPKLHGTESATREFVDRVRGLEGNLGLSFLQLPPSFAPRDLPALAKWLETLPPDFNVAVEFRHPDWFDHHALVPEASLVLEAHGAATVILDVAGRRDVLHMTLTKDEVFLRFIGNDLHASDYSRVHEWVSRIHRWQMSGLRELYWIVHEPGDTYAPDLIRVIVDELNKACALSLLNWTPQLQGSQLDLF